MAMHATLKKYTEYRDYFHVYQDNPQEAMFLGEYSCIHTVSQLFSVQFVQNPTEKPLYTVTYPCMNLEVQ